MPITLDRTDRGARRGVVLLFRDGARPDAAAVHALAKSSGAFAVTHDNGGGLELLVNGLTFDLVGLAGGPAGQAPPARHRFGLDHVQLDSLQAVGIDPGPHLVGGETMLPIVRSHMALTLRLAELPGLVAIAWAPARSWMAVDYFRVAVSAWLEGGAFPALGLTATAPSLDGGLQSEGLAFFTGQELRIEPELAEDRERAIEIAVRLLNELVEHGPVEQGLQRDGPDGLSLLLEPSANGSFVRVRAGK